MFLHFSSPDVRLKDSNKRGTDAVKAMRPRLPLGSQKVRQSTGEQELFGEAKTSGPNPNFVGQFD